MSPVTFHAVVFEQDIDGRKLGTVISLPEGFTAVEDSNKLAQELILNQLHSAAIKQAPGARRPEWHEVTVGPVAVS